VKSRRSKQFRALFDALPESAKQQAREAYRLWQQNPYHPGLHFKPVDPADPDIYSARVGGRYRVIGTRQPDGSFLWVWIGTHEAYNKLV
jgi:mRNA-degrading endonuclease RelE of RelBE toxin-antitoxin system